MSEQKMELIDKDEAIDRMANRIAVLEAENNRLRAASTPGSAGLNETQKWEAVMLGDIHISESPEAAGRGDGELMHALWVRGNRLRAELKDALVLHPENWHEATLKQLLDSWDAVSGLYASFLAAPPSGEQGQPKKLTLTEVARIASGKDMQPPSKPIRFGEVKDGASSGEQDESLNQGEAVENG